MSRRLLLAAFLWLATLAIALAVGHGPAGPLDRALLLGIAQPVRAAVWPVPLFLLAAAIGSAAVRLPLAALMVTWLAWRRDPRGAIVVAAATIGALAGNGLLKLLVGRARPDLLPHLAVETSLSFPSGHAASAAAVGIAIGWALVRRGASARRIAIIIALLVLAIGLSRVVLAVHWPSDVVAGWCFGGGWALACIALAGDRVIPRRVRGGQGETP